LDCQQIIAVREYNKGNVSEIVESQIVDYVCSRDGMKNSKSLIEDGAARSLKSSCILSQSQEVEKCTPSSSGGDE